MLERLRVTRWLLVGLLGTAAPVLALDAAGTPDEASAAPLEPLSLPGPAVESRLYPLSRRWEVGVSAGVTLVPRLTQHTGLEVQVARHLSELWSIGGRLGFTWGPDLFRSSHRHTEMARSVAEAVAQGGVGSGGVVDDFANLWELQAYALGGARLAPVYGKLSLAGELAVHFQAFAFLGAGVGQLHRESVVYCVRGRAGGCDAFLKEDRFSPVAAAAAGLRLFLAQRHSVALELRDYLFPDTRRQQIDLAVARAGGTTGVPHPAPGVTHLAQAGVGYLFLF